MHQLLRKVLFVLVTICLATLSSKTYASHYAAADLYVTYVGAGADGCSGGGEYKYEITFVIYTSCPSGNPTTAGTFRIWSDEKGFDSTFAITDVDAISFKTDTVDQLCPGVNNKCTQAGSQFDAFVRNTYVFAFNSQTAQSDWKFSASVSCCRNAAYNIAGVSGVPLYVESCLNNKVKYNNSTPRFTVDPFPYLCINQPAKYLNGPIDPENDSLATYILEPLSAAGAPLPYDNVFPNNYTVNDPVGSSTANPFKMDTGTGTATFTPIKTGKATMAFRCDEYERKTGLKMGYAGRDVQITIYDCNTPPPPIDDKPLNVTGGTFTRGSLIVCPGSNVTFEVNANSTDPNALIYLETNIATAIPTAFFTLPAGGPNSNGTANPKGTFTWTPSYNNLGEHTLIVTGKDSTCSGTGFALVLRSYQVLQIRVVPGLDAGPDIPFCAINPESKQLFVNGTDGIDFMWKSADNGGPAEHLSDPKIKNPVASPTVTTAYAVESPDLTGACKNKDTVVVYVDTTNLVDVFPKTPLVMCRPEYLQLDAIVTGKGPISNLPCGINNKNNNPECVIPDSIGIFGSPVFGRIPYDSVGGAAPTLHNIVHTEKFQFLVRRQDMKTYGMNSATIRSISFETAHNGDPLLEYSNFRIAMKCTNRESLSPQDGFETNMVSVYEASGPRNFIDGIQNFDLNNPYNWDTSKNLIIEMCYSNNAKFYAGSCYNPLTPQSPIIKYAPTQQITALSYYPLTFDPLAPVFGGAYVPDTLSPDVCGVLKSPNNNIIGQLARPVFGFKYCDAPSTPFSIKWNPGTLLSDSTILQPLSYVPQSTKYIMETYGKSGCLLRDSIVVYMPTHDFSVWPKDSAICLGESAPMEVRKGTHAIWHEYVNGQYLPADQSLSCTRCLNPMASPKVTTTYKVEIADSVWCFDTLEVTVIVLPPPGVHILNNDTTVKYGQPIQLMVSGARLYNWTPSSSLNNSNIANPIAIPTESTEYVVAGIGRNGCRTYDTVRINVDYRNKLLVPSAFTPNGDGKNDMFNIANLTFQRVMEFRVFNRWGQEVFQGNNNTGWDGKWKGAPQDMGNYQYLIRLGYPDGLVETYKGEVTLIR